MAIAPSCSDRTPPLRDARRPAAHFDDELAVVRRLVQVQPRTTGSPTGRTSPSSSSASCASSRTPRSCSRTSSTTPWAPRARSWWPHEDAAVRGDARGGRAAAAQHPLPGAGDPRHRGPLPAGGSVRHGGAADQRRTSGPRGLRAPADGPRPGRGQPRDQGLRRPRSTGSAARAAASRWTRGTRRRPRVLYLSSPIGLGHVRRDLAIADALREAASRRRGGVADPVTGDRLPRAARARRCIRRRAFLASESTHIESESGEHDLHAFQAIRRMDEVLVNNFMVFDDLVSRESFDLWVGDEAWDLDHFLHENPELKRAPFVWMTDFVGWMPMADGGEREAFLDRGLQRRDGRARRPLPLAARPLGLRRRPGRRGRRAAGSGPAERARVDQGALRVHRLRDGRAPRSARSGRRCAAGSGYARRATWSAWSAWAAPGSARTCCAAWLRRTTRPGAGSPT